MLKLLRIVAFMCAGVDLAALAAHLLELPNKLAMDGPLWLAVQQNLYRGWGPTLGPFEVGAVVTSIALAIAVRRRRTVFRWTLGAALGFIVVLALFFVCNAPVNAAFARWTADTLPPDWEAYRAQWEWGHAVRAILALAASGALVRAALLDSVYRER